MTPADWAGIAVSIIAIVTGFAAGVRWLVKHYLYELKPNGGSSLKDTVTRLEQRVDEIYKILAERE
jgi:uncharacterized membrane protein